MPSRTLELSGPLDLRATLAVTGLKGPWMRVRSDGLWRATRTPYGSATMRLSIGGGEVTGEAWGDGAEFVLDHLGDWIGQKDDPSALHPQHEVVAEAARAGRGMRMASVGGLVEALLPTIIAQKVTGVAAGRSYRQLVARYGEPAPGPAGFLRLPPDPR